MIIDGMQNSKPNRERFLEWQAGGVGCVHVTIAIWEDARTTLSAIGEWNRLYEANADLVELAKNGDDIDRICASGRTAVIYGFQDTSPIEDDLELVEIFHTLGVRIIQLTYNVQNRVAVGCWEDDDRGVSKFFGVNVIREMNKLGMVIDLSHCNEQTCLDTVEHSSRPVTITHGNPAEFVGQEIELIGAASRSLRRRGPSHIGARYRARRRSTGFISAATGLGQPTISPGFRAVTRA